MYLYGASGHARVIIDILNDVNVNDNGNSSLSDSKAIIEGLFDDNPDINELCGVPVFHEYRGERPVIISIGNNKIRKQIAERILDEMGENEALPQGERVFGTAVHPSAVVSAHATIGEGTVVMAGAIINHSAQIGRHCIVNTGASIDHECQIGDFAHISPHATLCGNVTVGEGSWIGAGAVVIPGIKIGEWATIGAGAVVVHDVPDGATVVGCPAKER